MDIQKQFEKMHRKYMDDSSHWVDDWEADIHHVDQVTSSVSDSLDLLQQLN